MALSMATPAVAADLASRGGDFSAAVAGKLANIAARTAAVHDLILLISLMRTTCYYRIRRWQFVCRGNHKIHCRHGGLTPRRSPDIPPVLLPHPANGAGGG